MQIAVEVGDASIADRAGWVYIVHAPNWQALYVGQTYSGGGALTRLAQHLSHSASATFRQRLCALRRYEDIDIGDVRFLAWRLLGPTRKFDQQEYREATEWGTQNMILRYLRANKIPSAVISRVRANAYVRDRDVEEQIEAIGRAVLAWLPGESSP